MDMEHLRDNTKHLVALALLPATLDAVKELYFEMTRRLVRSTV
jgi:hypothetical protein